MRIHRSYCDVLMRLSFLLSSYLFELLGRHMAIPTVSLFRHALHSAPNPAHCPVLTGALVLWLAAGSGRCETQTGHRRAGGWEVRLSCLFPPFSLRWVLYWRLRLSPCASPLWALITAPFPGPSGRGPGDIRKQLSTGAGPWVPCSALVLSSTLPHFRKLAPVLRQLCCST